MEVALIVILYILTAIAVVMSWRAPNVINKATERASKQRLGLQPEAPGEAVNSPQPEATNAKIDTAVVQIYAKIDTSHAQLNAKIDDTARDLRARIEAVNSPQPEAPGEAVNRPQPEG